MFFSKAEIAEIRERLSADAVKDSQFPSAEQLKGTDTIAIVQDGVNKKIPASVILDEVKHPYISLERIRTYLYRVTFDSLPEDSEIDSLVLGGCSSYVKDGKLYRNLDFNYDHAASFIVRTNSFEGMSFVTGLNAGNMNDKLIAQLPYRVVDGINNYGIKVSTHVLFNDWDWNGCGEKSISLTKLPFLILTKAKSINTLQTDLAGILNNLYASEGIKELGYLIQILVTDGTRTCAILPPVSDGESYVIQDITSNPKLSNFRWVNRETVVRTEGDIQNRPTGVERFNAMPCELKDLRFTKAYEEPDRLSEFIGLRETTKSSTDQQLLAIYNTAHDIYLHRERDGQTWHTMHSVVYADKMEELYIQENWDDNCISGIIDLSEYAKKTEVEEGIRDAKEHADDVAETAYEAGKEDLREATEVLVGITERIDNKITQVGQELTVKLEDAKERISEAEGQIEEAKGKIDDAEEQIGEAKERISSAEGEISDAKERLAAAEGDISTAKVDIDEAKGEIAAQAERLDQTEGTITNVGIRLSAAEGTIVSQASEIDTINEHISDVNVTLDAHNARITNNASRIDVQGGKITEAELAIDGANARIDLQAESIETLEGRVSTAEIGVDGANARIDIQAERIDTVTDRVSNAELAIDGANARIDLQAQEIDTVAARVSEAEINIDGANARIDLQAEQVDVLSGRVSSAEVAIDGAGARIDLLADNVNTVEGNVSSLGIRMNATEGTITTFNNWKDTATGQLTVMEEKWDNIDATITTTVATEMQTPGSVIQTGVETVVDGKAGSIVTTAVQTVTEDIDGILEESSSFSQVSQETDRLKSTVGDATNGLVHDVSVLDQTSQQISARVTSTEDALSDGEGGLLSVGEIKVTADETSMAVTNGDNYATIVARINGQTGESQVMLSADKIYLLGETVAEQLTALRATIENLTLENALVHGTIESVIDDVVMWQLKNDGTGSLAAGKISWDDEGNLYIQAEIEAVAGSIGGWDIAENKIYSGNVSLNGSGTIENKSGNVTLWALNANGSGSLAKGNITWGANGNATFTGGITATSLSLGSGVTISSSKISGLSDVATSGSYNDLSDQPDIPTTSEIVGLIGAFVEEAGIIDDEGNVGSLISGYVTSRGYQTASDVQTALSALDYNNVSISDSEPDEKGIIKRTITVTPHGGTPSTYTEYYSEDGKYLITDVGYGDGSFDDDGDQDTAALISTDGLLKAKNAVIYGTIYSHAGQIGGWTIGQSKLSSGDISIQGHTSSADGYIQSFSDDTTHWKLNEDGSGLLANNNVYWDEDGNFTIAGNATISGGTIGGWTIDEDKIYSGTVAIDSDGNITNKATGQTYPYWHLDSNGAGGIAKNNIHWDQNGTIYFPQSVVINSSTVDLQLISKLSYFLAAFKPYNSDGEEIDWSSPAAQIAYVQTPYNFSSEGNVSAGGVGQGGSGGDGILAMYIKTPSGRVRIDDIDTRAAEFGIKVNGTLATPVDGVISINTSSGSVTSVALSVPTGFSVTGSPITSSGTLAIGFASGYSLPTTAKQTLWDTAYGWGNHANAGYLKAADLTDIENGLKSLQSQIDSVSARDSFDELTVSSMFADVLAASVIYGTLHGNADTATDASMLGGHASSYFATASALSTHTGNTSNPHSVTFAQLLSKPTTISGYGITDAYTKTQVDAKDITAVSLTASKLTLTRTNGNLEAAVPTWNQDTTGNAATATKLKTARSIWGQNFDGTTAISGNMSGVGTINFTGKATDEIGLEIVIVGGVRYLHTTLPFYSDSNISAGGVGSGGSGDAIWGAIEGTLSNQTDLWNVLQGKQASLGVGTNGQILATKNGAIAWVDAPATGVTSVINLTGDITQAQLRTALGLGSAAYTESSAYAAASHTHSQYITGITSSMVIAALGYTPYNSSNPAGYLVASDLANIEKSIQSLQSQVDSVSARDGFDELYATSLFSDIIVGTNIYGALHGNADSATNADTLDGQHASYFQPLATAINTGNIASQSVARAHGLTSVRITASFDLDTRLSGGGVVGNYGSINYLVNGPSGMGYGSVAQIQASADREDKLALQLAWDVNHASSTPTRRLWFRSSNDGWGHDWKEIYHSGNCNNTSTPWNCSSLHLAVGGKVDNGGNYGLYVYGSAPDYGSAIYLTHDHGQNQTAFRIHSHYDSGLGGLSVDFSTTAQSYGTSPLNATYSNIVHIRGNGNVGIGTTSPSEKLHVAGNVYSTGNYLGNGEVTAGSDARWKHNITPVLNGIDAIMKLQPSEWEWNSDNHKGSGLIAQSVQSVLPHLVKTDGEGYLHLTYDGLHAYEISAIQSHETRIQQLERENAELKRKLHINYLIPNYYGN